ncbi:hypothetical protein Tcan_05104 [Toxocara canis]|uniref:Uncharacterized protein n=1 Tax=Toxocara canis TaxID=6265 RepID=A0A0B2W0E4_TOXCA|nr:hypothetical protein Tcan_05104 [Toxocara canis]
MFSYYSAAVRETLLGSRALGLLNCDIPLRLKNSNSPPNRVVWFRQLFAGRLLVLDFFAFSEICQSAQLRVTEKVSYNLLEKATETLAND